MDGFDHLAHAAIHQFQPAQFLAAGRHHQAVHPFHLAADAQHRDKRIGQGYHLILHQVDAGFLFVGV